MTPIRTKLEVIQVHVIVKGDRVRVMDRDGRVSGRWYVREQLEGSLASGVEVQLRWEEATQRLARRAASWVSSAAKSSWEAKSESLAKSFRLRALDKTRPRGRCRFESYSTKTWEEATLRLWHQANNRARRHDRNGWVLWSHTVSNNHNKRKGGRYARSQNCHRKDDHATR